MAILNFFAVLMFGWHGGITVNQRELCSDLCQFGFQFQCHSEKLISALQLQCNWAPCGLRGCKNWPAPFPGQMSYKATKPGLVSVLYLSMHYMVLLFIRAPFYVLLVFIAMCCIFWLFWLSYQYLPSDWIERLVCVPILLCFLGQLSHHPYSSWH